MPPVKFLAMPFGHLRRRLDQSRIYDWAMRCPIMVYCSFMLFRDVAAFCQQMLQQPALFAQFDSGLAVAMLARISQWMFVVLLSIQPLFRLRAIAKSDEILPRIAALIAVCVPLMFMQLDRAPPSIAFNLMSVLVMLVANVMCVVTASFLGGSLSVMPEARRLVESGPYGIVRHPLYLCELLATAGVALQYRSLPAAALLLSAIALQVARARWEEGVLARAFPEFAEYRSHTSFLVPSDPVHFFASFLLDPAVRRRSAVVVVSVVAILALVAAAMPRLLT
ncbi:MAG TPA: methyltransferase [Xanthobacteraceae bacterium]|nr:methyltransferase [Xanthobacteraceae bacterium]